MSNRKRLKFQCRECQKTYEMTVDLEGAPLLHVACPYCGAEGEVETALYRRTTETVLRGEETLKVDIFDFPETVPTRPRSQKEEANIDS